MAACRLSKSDSAELFSGDENSFSVDVVCVRDEDCLIIVLVRITGTGAAGGQTLLMKSFQGSLKNSVEG